MVLPLGAMADEKVEPALDQPWSDRFENSESNFEQPHLDGGKRTRCHVVSVVVNEGP